MKKTKVKICGIRSVDGAREAVQAGADFIGLVFVPSSRNFVTKAQAQKIIASVAGQVEIVGVFRNELVEKVNAMQQMLGLDYVQLHGEEGVSYFEKINAKKIKAFSVDPSEDGELMVQRLDRYSTEYFLIDRVKQGCGDMVSDVIYSNLAKYLKRELFLSGGLTLDNLKEKITNLHPFAVDVSGGVETEGQKDYMKIQKFITLAKEDFTV